MNELFLGLLAVGGLLGLVLACLFYMLGGRQGKWQRRVLASGILAGTNLLIASIRGLFNWWELLSYPLLVLGFSVGYGADVPLQKIIKRSVYAASVMSAGLVYAVVLGGNAWLVVPLHVGVGVWSIWLGMKNPLEAAAEETMICALLNLGFLMYVFVR